MHTHTLFTKEISLGFMCGTCLLQSVVHRPPSTPGSVLMVVYAYKCVYLCIHTYMKTYYLILFKKIAF